MTDLKLCKDCRWCLTGDRCGHTNALLIDYVAGKHTRFACQTERRYATERGCGPEARNFEEAKPEAAE